jgi:LPXTG-motif cell wall-anchored protein
VPANVSPCGDKPCGPADAAAVNPPADAAPPENAETPASTAPAEDQPSAAGEAAQPFDGENTGSSSSGWVLPVIFVALAALALFWVVRRNRDAEVDAEA